MRELWKIVTHWGEGSWGVILGCVHHSILPILMASFLNLWLTWWKCHFGLVSSARMRSHFILKFFQWACFDCKEKDTSSKLLEFDLERGSSLKVKASSRRPAPTHGGFYQKKPILTTFPKTDSYDFSSIVSLAQAMRSSFTLLLLSSVVLPSR